MLEIAMGTYERTNPPAKRSLSDTLLDAEADHLLDCQNADFMIRASALVLDIILVSLAWSAIHHICLALGGYLANTFGTGDILLTDPRALLRHTSMGLKCVLLYGYLIIPVHRYGGSPAKLLLGLRVVDELTGHKLGLSRAVFREAIGKLLSTASAGLGFLVAAARPDQRTFHDLMSRTVVKRVHTR